MNLRRRGTSLQPRTKRPARPRASGASGLVELVPAVAGVAVATKACYVLDVAGARIEFGDDASVSTLRRVLEALRSC